jgi:methionyl aminopeptidase
MSIDFATSVNDFVGDNTQTIVIGSISPEMQHLIDLTERALIAGINASRSRNTVGHISAVIQSWADETKLSVVRELISYDIGRDMHEKSQILSYNIGGQDLFEIGLDFGD